MKKTSVLKKLALLLLLALGATLGTAPSSAQQPAGYTITDLGPALPHSSPAWLYGDAVSTVSMNAAGDEVAATPTASGNTHAALFHNAQVIDLGTLGGLNNAAPGINKSWRSVGNWKLRS